MRHRVPEQVGGMSLLRILLTACVVCTLGMGLFTPLAGAAADNGLTENEILETVSVYNWSEYIPEGVLADFTKETGIQVKYSTYDNNEVMYTRLKLLRGRGYDVLVPSTSLVGRMRDEGLIQELDHKQLPHLQDLSPNLLNKSFDPGNQYSIPYLWGSAGIGINSDHVDATKVTKWADLWHKSWRDSVLLTDDMREAFHMALAIDGHSTNTQDPEEIKQAYERLKKLMRNVKVISAEPRAEFLAGNVNIGEIWNGDAVVAQAENPAIRYIYPEEGASFWIDSFVIPARAANVENAHKFIDFMLRPDIAARCVQELGYAASNLKARALLPPEISNNPAIFPPDKILAKAEFQEEIGEARNLYLLYWGKLKAGE